MNNFFDCSPVSVCIDSGIQEALLLMINMEKEELLVLDKENQLLGYVTWHGLLSRLLNNCNTIDIYHKDYCVLFVDQEIPYGHLPEGSYFIVFTREQEAIGIIKRNDLAVKITERRLLYVEKAIEHARIGILAIDLQGRINILNKRSREIAEFEESQHIYLSPFADIYDDHSLLQVLVDQKEQLNKISKFKDSKLVINRSPIYNDQECFIGAVSVYEEQRQLEEMSKQLESVKNLHLELKTIVDSIYDEIMVVNNEGKVIRVTEEKGYNFWGFDNIQLIGQNIFDLEEKGYFKPSVTRLVLEKKKKVSIIQENRFGFKILAVGNPILNENGDVDKIIIASRDIDEIFQLKEELAEARTESAKYQQEIKILKSPPKLKRELIYKGDKMMDLLLQVEKVARVDSTVLIYGESGVGKEVIAENIHHLSKRCDHPFIKVNCGAIPENLLESELFGYEKGAFTGALTKGKAGMFELANKGTLFLDEIGEMPLNLQVKLLQAIQDRKIIRVGGSNPIPLDIKIIAATNKSLEKMVEEKQFREDLYYRLAVILLYVPALSERMEDIESIAFHFLRYFNTKYEMDKYFSEEALELLRAYHWPGNVRELQNIVERVVVTVNETLISSEHITSVLFPARRKEREKPVSIQQIIPLKEMISLAEEQLLKLALKKYTTTSEIAKALDISQPTAWRKIQDLRNKKLGK